MRKAIRQTGPWLMCIIPLFVVGCTGAHGAGDYKTVKAYDKVTGEYFDVKVPYESHLSHGRLSKDEPSQAKVEGAVDKATWNHESSSSIDNYLHGGDGRGSSRGSNGMPGSTPTSSGPSPFDHSTMQGSSYHDSSSPFGR
jgi:hypothetical protein